MGNIIKFQKPALSPQDQESARNKAANRNKRTKERDQINQRIASLGGEAIESLSRWRRGLPVDDRVRLAKNMDSLIREYRVRPGKLSWEVYDYPDKESFYRDLSRMRLPETAEPGRRLLAHNTRWLHLLEMVHQYCIDLGERVTLEALAERLTRGTRFHPTKKIYSRAEKLLYSLTLWANEIDERYGLLEIYHRIAEARAEHFESHMRDWDTELLSGHDYDAAFERPADNFTDIPEEISPLFERELGSYTDDDWRDFFSAIPEECKSDYDERRNEVEIWQANFNLKSTLFCGWGNSFERECPSLSGLKDIAFLPRWFIGFYDGDNKKLLSRCPRDPKWPAWLSYKTGTLEPENANYPNDWECFVYLVLYPNPEMGRIVPYFYSFAQEGSTFERLQEDHLISNEANIFQPVGPETEAIAKSMQNRIEEDYPLLRDQWIDTAKNLNNHPLLTWSESRETMIDAEIKRLTSNIHSADEEES